MTNRLVIGSLEMEIKPNHLVKLTITAKKDDRPVSFVSPDHLRQMVAFYDAWLLEQEDDGLDPEDIL